MHIPFLHKDDDSITARWIVMLIDISIVLQSFFIAYLIRFNFNLENFGAHEFVLQLPFVALLALLSFYLIGSYKGVVRHTGTRDAANVFLAAALLALFLATTAIISRTFNILIINNIPLSIISIHFLLNVVVLVASRYIFKYVYGILTNGISDTKRILIYGAGNSGIITYKTIVNDPQNILKVIGFIDDNKNKSGKKYDRVSIYHSNKLTEKFVKEHKIREIIVSIQNIATSDLMKIVEKLTKLPVKVKIVPPVESWIDGTLKVSQIKEVHIDDLLNRKPIELNNPTIEEEIENKVVLITGAAGSIGSELARQISFYKFKKLILIDQAESPIYSLQQSFVQRGIQNVVTIVGDIRDHDRMKALFEKYPIQIIYHAAAYKHVPLMELFPYEAVRVNIFGSKNLMDLANQFEVEKFVMISTDKAVNPTNVMGASKRIAELCAAEASKYGKTKFIATRFGNVLGSNGSVIPLFKKQIADGGPLTVTHVDITRFFMTIPEACQLVLEAGAMGKGGEVFVFDMGESVKIFDLAKRMIQLSGFKYPEEIDIKIVGLRPGEKLYEELLNKEENTLKTHHPKILIAKVNSISKKILLHSLEMMKNNMFDKVVLVKEMKKLVPEFISNNSEFSQLDNN